MIKTKMRIEGNSQLSSYAPNVEFSLYCQPLVVGVGVGGGIGRVVLNWVCCRHTRHKRSSEYPVKNKRKFVAAAAAAEPFLCQVSSGRDMSRPYRWTMLS
jgi:hypothetical protein